MTRTEKERREELRMKKKEKMKKNGKGKRGRPKKSKTNDDNDDDGDDDENEDDENEDNDIIPMNCPTCKGSYHDEKVWLECEFCHQWYHADCAGYSGWIKEDLHLETFFCSSCI